MSLEYPHFTNPFAPGAGHRPPYLAGRNNEKFEFSELLKQSIIRQNLILTGLRGIGKTVLLEEFRPISVAAHWLWAGTDLSESASLSDERIATRLLTDLALVTANLSVTRHQLSGVAYAEMVDCDNRKLSYETLLNIYRAAPGLPADKLKVALEIAWTAIDAAGIPGVVFAYDEAQNLSDHAGKEQYPLSLLLDVFQSIQRKGFRFLLVLTGLPTLFPRLVEARTYSERMFHVVFLKRLSDAESRAAITEPIARNDCPVTFGAESVDAIVRMSGGYPYFIQFICKEVYDIWMQSRSDLRPIPQEEILRKLDSDFFAGRWSKATDRQRHLLTIIASILLDSGSQEFTVQEIVERSKEIEGSKPFSSSHVNQMLVSLAHAGLVYKDRHGKYLFAVPLLDQFILRQVTPRF